MEPVFIPYIPQRYLGNVRFTDLSPISKLKMPENVTTMIKRKKKIINVSLSSVEF